jgi:hypothetical protein
MSTIKVECRVYVAAKVARRSEYGIENPSKPATHLNCIDDGNQRTFYLIKMILKSTCKKIRKEIMLRLRAVMISYRMDIRPIEALERIVETVEVATQSLSFVPN